MAPILAWPSMSSGAAQSSWWSHSGACCSGRFWPRNVVGCPYGSGCCTDSTPAAGVESVQQPEPYGQPTTFRGQNLPEQHAPECDHQDDCAAPLDILGQANMGAMETQRVGKEQPGRHANTGEQTIFHTGNHFPQRPVPAGRLQAVAHARRKNFRRPYGCGLAASCCTMAEY